MKKILIGIVLCMLLLASIPLTTGAKVKEEQDEEPVDLVGLTWVRGWIVNPRIVLGMISARALRLHYIELTGMETHAGIVRAKQVTFRDGLALRYVQIGPLGTITWVMGFIYGGINIQN